MKDNQSKGSQTCLPGMTAALLGQLSGGSFLFGAEGRGIVASNSLGERMTGFSAATSQYATLSCFFADQEEFLRVEQCLEEGKAYHATSLLAKKSGQHFWSDIQINRLNIEGQYFYDLLVIQEHRERRSDENRLAEKIFNSIQESVLYTDLYGNILSVNPAFEIVTGYTEAEVIGKRPNILQSGRHDKEFYGAMWKEIERSGHWSGEIWNRRKNGDVYLEWLDIQEITDSSGIVTNYLGLFTDITERKRKDERLEHLIRFDDLTGSMNRNQLKEELDTLVETSKRNNHYLAVLDFDLDRFKGINETFGHERGDLLLKMASARVKGVLKNKELIARISGDEFVVILPQLKHGKEAIYIAQEIMAELKKPYDLYGQNIFITASMGAGLFPFDGQDGATLMSKAEKALFAAKVNGGNALELYHEGLQMDEMKRRRMLENKLHTAIEKNELSVHYQPQVNLKTGEVIGAEALLRWNEAELGPISPGEFIPIAEEAGLIIPISQWVIKQACEDVKKLHISGYPNFKLSLNISSLHFIQPDFAKEVIGYIENTNINPYCVELELTESMVMPHAQDSINKLMKLKRHGMKLSIDDFGTGYSSLSYLQKFPIDTLKIDQSFIRNLMVYQDDAAITKAIITMSKSLHLEVIAEGVENKKIVDFLKEQKCDIIQGFYISKPLPFRELEEYLKMWEPVLIKGK